MPTVCPESANCGYLVWLLEMGQDSDCGKVIDDCGRLNPNHPVPVTEPGPATHEELTVAGKIFGYPPKQE